MEENTIKMDYKVESVIVYQEGVQITCIGSMNLKSGENMLRISDLPDSLDKESVRVKGIGRGKIVNINVNYNSRKQFKKEQFKQLQDQRKSIKKKIDKNQKKIARLNEQIIKFKTTEDLFLNDWSKAYAFGEVELDSFLEFDDKINDSMSKFRSNIDTLKNENAELQKDLSVVTNKISKLGPLEEVNNFYEVILNLYVEQQGDFAIEIRYTMPDAWWVPFYDVSLNRENALLSMMANVYNRTGLGWDDVNIEISTASLKPIRLVKPDPIILKEYIPPPPSRPAMKRKMSKPRMMEKKMDIKMEKEVEEEEMDFDDFVTEAMPAEPEPEPVLEHTVAEVSDSIGIQSFKLPNKATIPSDKNPHPVILTHQELEVEKHYFWSSISPAQVIIRDTLINGSLLLLPGNAKIYYLEEFLGETDISLVAPKEKFKLGTRISYDLKIEKKLIDRSKDKKILKGKLKNHYAYEIKVKNLNEVGEDLTLYDRIPHSNSENINVEIEEMVPEPNKNQLGVLKWNLNMKGLPEKTIKYSYVVEYKKDVRISPALP